MRFSFTWNSSTLNRHVPSATAASDNSAADLATSLAWTDPGFNTDGVIGFSPDISAAASAAASVASPQVGLSSAGSFSLQSLNAAACSMDIVGSSAGPITSAVSSSAALNADALRSTFGVDGTGIKIGVLSDSFNVLGGAAADEADGALPASGVQVIEEGPNFTDLSRGIVKGTDEGRAMLQLIHQIAPDASLAFATADFGQANFASNITALVNAGCNIIVDDITYFDEPFFQNGVIAQAINAAAALGVACFSSAGNEASNAYQAAYSPMTAVLANGTFDTQNFGGGSPLQTITMDPQDVGVLEWDQPWGAASSTLQISAYQNGQFIGSLTNDDGANPAISFATGSPFTETIQIAISVISGPNPGLLKYVLFGDGRTATIDNFVTNSGTLVGHHAATGEVAVAAADYTTPTTPEFFTSSGPAQLLFADNGARLGTPITTNIGVTGVDGEATSVFNTFFGTSAAAPTAAAVAALLEQAAPADSGSTIDAAIENTATNLGSPNLTGHGLVNALAAGDAIATPHVYVENINVHTINVGSGSNTIVGGAGSHTVHGGTGGPNTLDYSGAPGAVNVNLNSGVAANGFGGTDLVSNVQIVKSSTHGGTLVATSGSDTFIIEGGNNTITGGAGSTTVDYSPAPGAMTANLATGVVSNGFGGTDSLSGVTKIIGGAGNDTFIEGPGSHTLQGGSGMNTLDFSGATGAANVNLVMGFTANGFGGTDFVFNIQIIKGSTHGGGLTGGNGNAEYIVEGGSNAIASTGGTLTVDYSNAPGPINVDLSNDTATNGFGGTDSLFNIGVVKGSTHGGSLTGGIANDTFVIEGGNNAVNGGGGVNTINYSSAPGAVNVNLATGTAINGFGGTDTLANIETVIGSSSANDTFTAGTGGGETFTGGSGHNTYNFTTGDGSDIITDFKTGAGGDQLNLTDTSGAPVSIVSSGSGYTTADFNGGVLTATTGDATSAMFASGDFLGNGKRDFVLRSASGDTLDYVWNGNGYTVTDFGSTAPWSAIATGDFNGDGKTDILIRLADGTTASWLANGSGGFRGVLASNSSGMNVAETGDFLGNGRTDILWSDASSNTSVWLANGDGTFTSMIIGATTGWSFIAAGDFNGDGKTDILMRLADGTTASWLANGSGGFRGVIAGNSAGMSIAETGDFVGNGRTDILWRDASNNTSVWLANGDGTFATVIIGPTTGWSFIGAGDFNGDGKTDILMRYLDGSVADWLSNGNGSFAGAILGKAGANWSVATIGDLNGDGKADVVWRNSSDGRTVVWDVSGGAVINGGSTTISDGAGDSIELLNVQPSGLGASQVVVTTPPIVGGPGNDTFVVTAGSHSYDGGGGFNTLDYSNAPGPITVNLATGTVSPNGFGGTDNFVRIQAFKGSASNDTFIGGAGSWTLDGGGGVNSVDYSAAPGAVTVNLATGTAANGFGGTDTLANIETVIGSSTANDTFTAGTGGGETFTGGSGQNTYNVASGDGHDVITNFKAGAGGDQLNLTDTNGAPVTITASGYTTADFGGGVLVGTIGGATSMVVASGDFTGNGKTDFILETPSTGAVQDELWNGSGYTTVNLSSVGVGAALLGAGNFQGNGKTSLLWRAADGTTSFWGANSDGTFTVSTIGQTGSWSFIASGDFNGDGRTDELLRNADGSTTADWLSNGAGMFTGKLLPSTAGMSVIATGEFAGTGRTDILWRAADGTTTEWTANSDGSFNATNLGNTSAWSFIASGDFLGNGKTDELLRSIDGTTTADWLSNGVGSFTGKLVASTAGMSVVATGDFNGDGRTDILWRAMDGTITTWLANGDGSFTSVMTGQAGMNWNVASIGNLDGDGNADVVWRDSADGRTVVWDMNGGAVTNGGTATISYGGSDSITLTGVSPSSLVSSQIAATIQGTAGNDTFVGSAANETFIGNGGSDAYQIARGGGQDRIVNGLSTNAGPTGQLDFGAGIATNQLWLQQSGNDLQIDVMGTTDHTTVANWYGSATAQLQEIKTADGSMLDAQLNNLVNAMATYSGAHPGFDPTAPVNTSAPNDSALQLAIATDWHH